MRRRIVEQGVRAKLTESAEQMRGLAESVGADVEVARCDDRLAALRAHRPVIVHHGWEIGLPHDSGPFLLEPDGQVVAVDVVTDPDRPLWAVNYRRADGSLVFEDAPV